MSKTTNAQQFEKLVCLLEVYPDIAQGFSKRGKEFINSFWENCANELNVMGPPIKDGNSWRKVWIDYKSYIKKKLSQNTRAINATGGAPNRIHTFTDTEERVIRLTGMAGIADTQSFGGASTSEETATVPQEGSHNVENIPMRRRRPKLHENEVAELLKTQIVIQKELNSNMKRVYRGINKMGRIHKNEGYAPKHKNEASKAKKRARTPSSTSEYSEGKRSSPSPSLLSQKNFDSGTNEDVETQNKSGDRLAERSVRKKKKTCRRTNLRKEVSSAIKKAENLLEKSVKITEGQQPATPYDWVGQLVIAQLGCIQDSVIRNDTIWAIQCALRKGIEQQQAQNQLSKGNEPDNNLLRTEDMDSESDHCIADSNKSFGIDIVGTNKPLNREYV